MEGTKMAEKKTSKRDSRLADKKRKKRATITYAVYLHDIFRSVAPDNTISRRSMNIMDSFINDLFDRIVREASRLARNKRPSTISAREIRTAVRLVLPGHLGRGAEASGIKAVTKYFLSNPLDDSDQERSPKPDAAQEKSKLTKFPKRCKLY